MTSRVLGLVRDQALAYQFGAGHAMDAFNVAFRIPNLMRDLFAEGAMSAAFVPIFTRRLTIEGKRQAWQLANHVVTALLIVTGLLAMGGIAFAGSLTWLFASDYAAVPGKLELTTTLTRIMFPFLTLVAIAAAAMGMLNALGRFFLPALSPAMFNVAIILAALTLVPVMAARGIDPMIAIAVGAVVGALGQVVVQWPALLREGYRFRPSLHLTDPGLREILLLMGPGTVGLAAVQVNVFVNTVLATGEGAGAVSWLNYAFRLMYLPIGLFGVSVATATLPRLSAHAAREELPGMIGTLSSALRLMMMLTVPAAVGLMALASPIVALIFERGRFAPADTAATAAALLFYAPGLIGYSAVRIAAPSFYALGESRTPVAVSIAAVLTNVALNLLLVRVMGYRGLALGTALAALLNGGLLLILLRRRLNGLDGRRLGITFAKVLVASAAMGLVAIGVEQGLTALWSGSDVISRASRLAASIGAGLATLIFAAQALRLRELRDVQAHLAARVLRRRDRSSAE